MSPFHSAISLEHSHSCPTGIQLPVFTNNFFMGSIIINASNLLPLLVLTINYNLLALMNSEIQIKELLNFILWQGHSKRNKKKDYLVDYCCDMAYNHCWLSISKLGGNKFYKKRQLIFLTVLVYNVYSYLRTTTELSMQT